MESFFSTAKTELGEHFESCRDAKMKLFDFIEMFYNQRRHSTLGQISPAVFEHRARAMEFDAQRPHWKPECNVASLDKRALVRRPISDAVFGLVLPMYPRIRSKIVRQLPWMTPA